jgi:hypothetical protein
MSAHANLTKGERRYLSRFECFLCEIPLHRDDCGSCFERCPTEVREKRRRDCLQGYRPRKGADR